MSKWLLLIPTEFELKQIESQLTEFISGCSVDTILVEVCGFGPISSAARTSQLLNKHGPDDVLLLGIAGAYSVRASEFKVGSAYQFNSVACYGIGVGSGNTFQTAEQMGWSQSVDSASIDNPISLSQSISNSIGEQETTSQLLTVCAASEGSTDVTCRMATFPEAVAEDMEGFAVAAACKMHDAKLTIVRGISNIAGERDKSKWQIGLALKSALTLSCEIIKSKSDSSEAT